MSKSKKPKTGPKIKLSMSKPDEESGKDDNEILQWWLAAEGTPGVIMPPVSKPGTSIDPTVVASVVAPLGNILLPGLGTAVSGLVGARQKLSEDILQDAKKISEQATRISKLQEWSKEKEDKIRSLTADLQALQRKESQRHLLDRVGPDAANALMADESRLRDLFLETERCSAYVVSIDLRRSTELMLKAREPRLFAMFITELARHLRTAITDNMGVFDKFTGDGILAFFPDFFSGEQAGLRAVNAARQCHESFELHYRANRHCFMAVMRDTGLGIGIDYGEVSLVQMQGDLTVVGTPVVYACRLGGANAGETLVNQPAYEKLLNNFSEYIDFRETSMDFKNEGSMVAYAVTRNEKEADLDPPEWLVEKAEDDGPATSE